MHPKRLRGVIAAIVTPILSTNGPDAARFIALARQLLDEGCDGLNVLGTTGEATSFSLAQRQQLMTAIAGSGLPLDRMMVGTGAASVDDASQLTALAGELGFAGALILPPFYYKDVADEGVVRYLATIADRTSSPIPIYLYNFPALSGVPYSIDLIKRLRTELGSRIAGLKDSSGNMDYANEAAQLGADFDVFPSNEATLLEARNGSFAGCISATANVNAPFCSRAFRDGDEGALGAAVSIRALFTGKPLVAGVKALVSHMRREPTIADPMPPLVRWSDAAERSLFSEYDRIVSSV